MAFANLGLPAALEEVSVWQTDKQLCVSIHLFDDTVYEEHPWYPWNLMGSVVPSP